VGLNASYQLDRLAEEFVKLWPAGRNTSRYTTPVTDVYRWPAEGGAELRDGLTSEDVIDALLAPQTLRMDNRAPSREPTFMAVCAPTDEQRLIVVVCTRREVDDAWTIVGARDASMSERQMWRKHTS